MMEQVEKRKTVIRYILLLMAVVFVVLGVYRGEMDSVFSKAIRLCMECVGIG